jgi:SAM-dependent methyltransferase
MYQPFILSEPDMRDYTSTEWKSLSDDEKEAWLDEIAEYWRGRGFPYPKYDDRGLRRALGRLKREPVGDDVPTKVVGTKICNHFFPNMYATKQAVPVVKETGRWRGYRLSPIESFESDKYLRKAIKFCLDYGNSPTSSSLRGAIHMVSGSVSRFNPLVVKWILSKHIPHGGTYYDFACGWGGRLLGASVAEGVKYLGVDPNTVTNANLLKLAEWLGADADIRCQGSETRPFEEYLGQVDIAFSSPPYYKLERYTDEETQCYNMYDEYDDWVTNYLEPTISHTRDLLKPGGVFAVNIVNCLGIDFGDLIYRTATGCGLKHDHTYRMKISQRAGNSKADGDRHEPIYIFRKD